MMVDRRKAFKINMIKAELFTYRQNFSCNHPASDDPYDLR
jgi:hypothetical protein